MKTEKISELFDIVTERAGYLLIHYKADNINAHAKPIFDYLIGKEKLDNYKKLYFMDCIDSQIQEIKNDNGKYGGIVVVIPAVQMDIRQDSEMSFGED